jgi:hypothetical protein
MKRIAAILVGLGLLAAGAGVWTYGSEAESKKKAPPKKEEQAEGLMHRKLQSAQKVLDGIATNDFEKITKHGNELVAISKEAEWKVLKTPRYELYSNEFRRGVEKMVQAAKEKNVDAAALGYVEVTLTCVRCHQHVREVRMTKLPRDAAPLLAGR